MGGSADNTLNTVYPTENDINRSLFDKSMKFCIVVFHDLTNDISYIVRSKICYLGGKIVKIICKNRWIFENCSIQIS